MDLPRGAARQGCTPTPRVTLTSTTDQSITVRIRRSCIGYPRRNVLDEGATMGTPTVWVYNETLRTDLGSGRDIVGYNVEATDDSIGKVDKRSTEAGRDYLVVDTGFWIFGHKRLIPAGVVRRVDHNERKIHVAMTKDEIKNAPDFDETMTANDEVYYDKHSSYYDRYGW
jgi:hypothetical protein